MIKLLWKELKSDVARFWSQDHRIIKISVVSMIPSTLMFSVGYFLLGILPEPLDAVSFLFCAYTGFAASIILALWLNSALDRVSDKD